MLLNNNLDFPLHRTVSDFSLLATLHGGGTAMPGGTGSAVDDRGAQARWVRWWEGHHAHSASASSTRHAKPSNSPQKRDRPFPQKANSRRAGARPGARRCKGDTAAGGRRRRAAEQKNRRGRTGAREDASSPRPTWCVFPVTGGRTNEKRRTKQLGPRG